MQYSLTVYSGLHRIKFFNKKVISPPVTLNPATCPPAPPGKLVSDSPLPLNRVQALNVNFKTTHEAVLEKIKSAELKVIEEQNLTPPPKKNIKLIII